jgi:ABC-type Fe3+ transport system substrate-binding protein
MARSMSRPARILLVLAGLSLTGYALHRYGVFSRLGGGGERPAGGGSSGSVKLQLLYGTEKERWLKGAVELFAQRQPRITVELKGMGTLESVRAIAEGKEKPAVWSPADEAALNLLDAEWSLAHGSSLIRREGELAPEPLVLTPLVMIAWEERAKVLARAANGDPTNWRTLHDLATHPKGWLGLGAPAEWGYVKPGHTAPNSSNSGLQTLILMAYGFHGKRSGLTPADVLHEPFQKWLRELESAVGKFGQSSGTYMREMILYGPSKYDLVWNYESVAISDMAAAQGRWGNLFVYYPTPTLWSNNPFVVFETDWVTAEQRAAAKELRAFLLSPEVQARALEFGFRPANPEVKVLTNDPANPWNRLRPFGVRADVPAVADPPSGEVTRLLLETWRRVVEAPAR